MTIKKLLIILLGFVALVLGAAGIIVPLLPTTPLVLLSAACFSRSNKKLDTWLRQSRIFGPFIENYRTGSGISKWHKVWTIAFLWIGLSTTMILARTLWIFAILVIVGICVTTHVLMIKTKVDSGATNCYKK